MPTGTVKFFNAEKGFGFISQAEGEDVGTVLEALSRGLTQKMLHGALAELHSADGEHRVQLAQTVSRLFLRQSTRLPDDQH